MKHILLNAGKMFAILTIALYTNTAKAQTNKDTAKTKTVTFTATDMGCRTDTKMVETALYRKKGVKSVKITGDLISVVYNPEKVKPEELKTVIENTGTCEDPNAKVHKVKIQ